MNNIVSRLQLIALELEGSSDNEVSDQIDRIIDHVQKFPDPWYNTKVPGLVESIEKYMSGPTDLNFQRKLLGLLKRELASQSALWRSDTKL